MKLWDLMDMDLYRQMLVENYIRVNRTGKYRILNYTESAQYGKVWNEVTRQCRGLIIDDSWNVVARSFDKFFNYGEFEIDKSLMDYRVEVTDKMDGSLGILFGRDPNRYSNDLLYYYPVWNVATKGSMVSDQAAMMEEILNSKYKDVRLSVDWTYMFEIIYPGNRIVLDYGDTADLFLLGARHLETGLVRSAEAVTEWTGPKTLTFSYETLREALEAPPRPNAEGFVVYFPDLDYRVKIKQADYVALHRIVTGLTERRIWENMKDGKTLFDLLEIVPDEWHEWLSEVHDKLYTEFCQLHAAATNRYAELRENTPKDFSRIDFNDMLNILNVEDKSLMYALYDGASINETLWKRIRPKEAT